MSALTTVDKTMPILVVDDYAMMRRVVKTCLRQLGFDNVTEAEDGLQALELLKSQSFQFIISDWSMPNMMGIDLLRAVRSDKNLKEIPFLMVTAEAQKEKLAEATKEGVSSYVVKPFTSDILQQKMEAIFTTK